LRAVLGRDRVFFRSPVNTPSAHVAWCI